jgi:hypothetical protein
LESGKKGEDMIKWGFWRKQETPPVVEEKTKEIVQEEPVLTDIDRVTNYFAKGGEIVDLSNKPRIEGDGFAPDHELLTPFNRAHQGTREGLASIVGRKK